MAALAGSPFSSNSQGRQRGFKLSLLRRVQTQLPFMLAWWAVAACWGWVVEVRGAMSGCSCAIIPSDSEGSILGHVRYVGQ